jgi:hypothetical protein
MSAVVDDQRREPERAGPLHENRRPRLEGRAGEAAPRLDPHNGRVVPEHYGLCFGHDLARPDRPQAALDPVDSMRLAAVALSRHDNTCERPCLGGA